MGREWAQPRIASEFNLGSELLSVRFSPDNQHIAASTYSGSVHIVDAQTGTVAHELTTGSKMPVMCVRWRPASAHVKRRQILVTSRGTSRDGDMYGEGAINHWHLQTERCLHEIQEDGSQTYSLDYTQDGSVFVSAGLDRKIRVYDEATKRVVQELTRGNSEDTAGHSNRVFAVKIDPTQPHVIASAGWDHTMQLWDLRKGHSVRSVCGVYVCGDALDFSPDGKTILTGSYRGKDALQLWDAGSAELVKTVKWEGEGGKPACSLFCARMSPAAPVFAAGGIGGTEARVFDLNGSVLASIPADERAIYSMDFSSDGKQLAIGDVAGRLRIIDF